MAHSNPSGVRKVLRPKYNLRALFGLTTRIALALEILIMILRLPPGMLVKVYLSLVFTVSGTCLSQRKAWGAQRCYRFF